MRNEDSGLSLTSIRFMFTHPWFFIVPVVIILTLVSSYISSRPLMYAASAIISFEANQPDLINAKLNQNKQDILDNVLIGENIKNIAKETWPRLKDPKNQNEIGWMVERLRNPGSGIRLFYDKEGKDNILRISFVDLDPKTCYMVVRATVDVIKRMGKERAEEEIGSGVNFLKKQLEFYKEKVKKIDEEISNMKVSLRTKYATLSEDERFIIDDMLGGSGSTLKGSNVDNTAKAQQIASYDVKLTDLNLEILELQKERESLQKRLKTKEMITPSVSVKDVEEDTFIKGYSSAIAAKELGMAEFLAQGFTEEHPQIKKMQGEIVKLNALREKRIEDITSNSNFSNGVKNALESNIKKRLKEIDAQLETLGIKINALESYRSKSEKGLKRTGVGMMNVSEQTSRLMELVSEKDVNKNYFLGIRAQLEAAEMKSRLQIEEVGFKIRVIELPKIPTSPMPIQKMKLMMLGFMLAASAGISMSYLADSLDSSIKSGSDLRELLQIPVLASIDKISTPSEVRTSQVRRNVLLIILVFFGIFSNLIMKILKSFLGRL